MIAGWCALVGCASTVPDTSGESHFVSCNAKVECEALGPDYDCIAGRCQSIDVVSGQQKTQPEAATSPSDSGDAATGTIELRGTLNDFSRPGGAAPLAEASVCVVDSAGTEDPRIPCATTAALGGFTLGGLPMNREVFVAFSKAGYDRAVRMVDVRSVDMEFAQFPGLGRWLSSTPPANPAWDPAVTIDTSLGSIGTFVALREAVSGTGAFGGGIDWTADVSVTIDPPLGNGPFHGDAHGVFVQGATGTRGLGGWFVNLPAREYVLTFTSTSLDCQAIPGDVYGFPAGDHRVRAVVVAGTTTQGVGVFCR
jgi:hypothetical protein